MTLALGRVLACASCVSTAYGDQSFNWAYGALIGAPFLVAIGVGAGLAWSAGYRIRFVSRRDHKAEEVS